MLTMNRQGTVFFIFSYVNIFILTASPERLSSLRVLWTKVASVLVSRSGLHAEVSRHIWKEVRW